MYRLQPTLPARGLLAGRALEAAGFWASEAAWLPNLLIATFRAIFQPLWNLSFDHPCLQQTLHWILSFLPHLNPPLYEVPLTSLLLTPSHRASSEGLFTGLCLFSGLCLSPLPISVVSSFMRSHPSCTFTVDSHLSPPLPQITTNLLHVFLVLPFMDISHKRSLSIHGSLVLASFTEHTIFEQQTGSKSGKECVKTVHCHPAYLTYMQCTSYEMPGWMKYKLESRLLGEISTTSDMQMTPLWQKAKRN